VNSQTEKQRQSAIRSASTLREQDMDQATQADIEQVKESKNALLEFRKLTHSDIVVPANDEDILRAVRVMKQLGWDLTHVDHEPIAGFCMKCDNPIPFGAPCHKWESGDLTCWTCGGVNDKHPVTEM